MIKRPFETRYIKLWKHMYASIVRPHLDYGVKAYSPHLQENIENIRKFKQGLLESQLDLRNLRMKNDYKNSV